MNKRKTQSDGRKKRVSKSGDTSCSDSMEMMARVWKELFDLRLTCRQILQTLRSQPLILGRSGIESQVRAVGSPIDQPTTKTTPAMSNNPDAFQVQCDYTNEGHISNGIFQFEE